MKVRKRHPIWNWVIHTPWVLTVIGILCVIGFFASGAGNPILQRWIVHRLGESDGRPRGIAVDFDPVAFDASHAEGIGDPRARAGWDAGLVFGERGGRGIASRFLLGPKSIAERPGAEGAGGAHPRGKGWVD